MPYVKDLGGVCVLCYKKFRTLENHHVCYDPEKLIRICHDCHFKIHFYPGRLTPAQKILLKQLRGKDCKRA